MSTTPIFDATLADAPASIYLASNIFPQPTIEAHRALCDRDWTYTITRWEDPANLGPLA